MEITCGQQIIHPRRVCILITHEKLLLQSLPLSQRGRRDGRTGLQRRGDTLGTQDFLLGLLQRFKLINL